MMNSAAPFIKTIPFSNLMFWDTKRYTSGFAHQFENARRLADILVPYKVGMSKEDLIKNDWQIISKINFGGELFLRNKEEIEPYKGNLYKVPSNSIIYSKINVRHGCVYYHGSDATPFAVSSEYPVFTFDDKKVNGEFIKMLLRSSEFKKLLNTKTSGISKARVKAHEFLDITVPLPSLAEQNRIVGAYTIKIQKANELDQKAELLEKDIEKYLFDVLGIKTKQSLNRSTGLNFTNFSHVTVWGADRLLRGGDDSILHSSIYPNKKLSEVTYINPRTDLSGLEDEDEMSFIPMECVSDDYGEIIELREGKKVNSKGYTKFQEGDLIWARITPCMQNGKSAIVSDLKNGVGYGSTEYHIIREKDKTFSIRFAHTLLRRDVVLKDAVNYFTGSAGQQRVPKSYLENLEVPVPPVKKQKEIADKISQIIAEVKSLQSKAEQNRERAIKEFEQEIFEG